MTIAASIVIPTYNRASDLHACLVTLLEQTLPTERFEVLVVDDGSSDDTAQRVAEVRASTSLQLRYFHQANRGPAAARNLGIEQAQADLIAFTDDDCRPSPSWLADLLESLPEDPLVAGVGGHTVRLRDTMIGRYIDTIGMLRHGVKNEVVLYLVTANVLFRRAPLQAVGGFEEQISWPGGEDPDLSSRLIEQGYRLAVTNKALLQHNHRDTLQGLYRTYRRYGQGEAARVLLGRKRGFFHSFVGVFLLACAGHFVLESVKLVTRRGTRLGDRLGFPFLRLISNIGVGVGYTSQRLKTRRSAGLPNQRSVAKLNSTVVRQ